MADKPKLFNIKSTSETEFVSALVNESLKLLDAYSSTLKYQFLCGIISHMVITSLKEFDDYGDTAKNLKEAKSYILGAVSAAFSNSLSYWAKRNVVYTCKLESVEVPERKDMN